VISSGFAGGLAAGLEVGDLVLATNFTSPELRARAVDALPNGFTEGTLLTRLEVISTAREKAQLAHTAGAIAVDMETEAIATACTAAGVPLLAIRAISDSAADDLPVPFEICFSLRKQRPKPLALFAYLATHPGRIVPFISFVSRLGKPRAALAEALEKVIAASPR
jgi:nucleoside phosphorylase